LILRIPAAGAGVDAAGADLGFVAVFMRVLS